jgi:hypothetical protein
MTIILLCEMRQWWQHDAVNASRENRGRRRIYHFNEVTAFMDPVFPNPNEITSPSKIANPAKLELMLISHRPMSAALYIDQHACL